MVDSVATRDTARDTMKRQAYRLGLAVAVAWTGVVAVMAFLWTWHGNYDYAQRVAQLGTLSFVAPISMDGATLAAVAVIFVMRHEPLRRRLYAWAIFGVATALSIGGNLSHGAYRHLQADGMAGAVAAPILLGLVSHLVIVAWRALDNLASQGKTAKPRPESPAKPTADVAPASARTEVARANGHRAHRAAANEADFRNGFYADPQIPAVKLAAALGVSRKTVERRYAELRAADAATAEVGS